MSNQAQGERLNKPDWWIDTNRNRLGRFVWEIRYPLSRYAIVGLRDFATKAAARRDAYRCIRIINQRAAAND